MKRVVRNITSEQKYRGKFNKKIHSKFKDIARKHNRSVSWYLNMKLENINNNNIELKKYNTTGDYTVKQLFLKKEIHKVVKRESYLKDMAMRDYIQSIMEAVIKNSSS
jgi:sialic acid synthase SpsE